LVILLQFGIGLVFGLGLLVSGMSNPAKVLNFLDLGGIAAGNWDPSLAFVMAGAVAVTFTGYRLTCRAGLRFARRLHLRRRDGRRHVDCPLSQPAAAAHARRGPIRWKPERRGHEVCAVM
jgi:uncharacterized membrane protein YedE/YeeE